MTIPSQHYANLSEDSYRLDHRIGFHPPGERDKVEIKGVIYEVVEFVDNKKTGYQGVIYQRVDTREIVVAHRGTEFNREPLLDGLRADGGMVVEEINSQAQDALEVTRRALRYAAQEGDRSKTVAPEVTVTGHSLGGCLAQIAAHHFDLRGETFNAYGAASLKGIDPNEPNAARVTNHAMAGDVVSAASRHYGQVVLYAKPHERDLLAFGGYGQPRLNDPTISVPLLGSHFLGNFVDARDTPHVNESVLATPAARQLAVRHADAIAEYRAEVLTLREDLTRGAQWAGQTWNKALDRSNEGLEQIAETAQRGAGRARDAVQDGAQWLNGVGGQGADALNRIQQGMQQSGKALRDWTIDAVRTHVLPQEGASRGTTDKPRDAANPQAALDPQARPAAQAAPTLETDPIGFLDRMLAAAKSGDDATFRQMTQQAAAGEGGRALREQTVAAVDRQEHLAREQAEQLAMQESMARQTQRSSGPVMG